MKNVTVIGGGPAGMTAAGFAAMRGASVTLIEKNEKLGKKLYITGKGRCNVTNASDRDGLISAVMSNARFMQSAFSAFGSADTMAFFEKNGVKLKTERGRRVFPASDKASDITKALERFMAVNGVRVMFNRRVVSIEPPCGSEATDGYTADNRTPPCFLIRTEPYGELRADAVIIATGGLSYPSTGSTGDGYGLAAALRHTVTATYPSLVPLITAEKWAGQIAGLSLKNIRCSVFFPGVKKPAYSETGEMMFTPSGVTGPLVLSASRYVTDKLSQNPFLSVDLKPGLSVDELDGRLLRDFAEIPNRDFANSLDGLLPKRLVKIIVELSGIEPERKVNAVTKRERRALAELLKGLRLTPVAAAGYNEAVITVGGVAVNEINPSTMMSKKVRGLFFAGEVMDVDALTGGYNLQIAFSTGYLAGISTGVIA